MRLLYVLPVTLLFGASAPSGAAESTAAPITEAAEVAAAKDDQPVRLRGKIVSRQGRNHYLIADESGNAVVKITRKLRNGAPLPPGTEIEIQGETDTRLRGPTRVEATSITVMAWTDRGTPQQPAPEPAVPQARSPLQ